MYLKLKYKRISSWYIETTHKNTEIRIGKDYGSVDRSKPLYFVQVDGVVIMHGFTTQKDAKKYVQVKLESLCNNEVKNEQHCN